METVIMHLPKLIEFNGQLRALLTTKKDETISKKEFVNLSDRMSKIYVLKNALKYNMTKILELYKETDTTNLNKQYSFTINSGNKLLDFINSNFRENMVFYNPEDTYEFFTKNINSMIRLYDLNSKLLNIKLKERIDYEISIRNYTITLGILCVIFILYNFFNYYRKNNDLINTINDSNIKLKEQSITDGLTQIYNRRYFEKI